MAAPRCSSRAASSLSALAALSGATLLSLNLGGCADGHTDNGADAPNMESTSDCILGTWRTPEDFFTDGPRGGDGTLTFTFTPDEVTTKTQVSHSFEIPQGEDGAGVYTVVSSGNATNPYTLEEDQISFDSATATDVTYVTTLVDSEGSPLANPVVSGHTDDLGGNTFTLTCTADNLTLAGTPVPGLPDSMQPGLPLVRVK